MNSNVDYTPWLEESVTCEPISITLSPASDSGYVGTTHEVTATVKDYNDAPVEGMEVSFTITDGPHAGKTGTATTDENGKATFNYKGTSAGTDYIMASCVDFHGNNIGSNDVTMIWVSPPSDIVVSVSLSPTSATRNVGETHKVTAVVTMSYKDVTDEPVYKMEVSFNITDGPHKGTTGTGTTDDKGRASFTYTGTTGPDTDTIVASVVDFDGNTIESNEVTIKWLLPPTTTPSPTPEITPTPEPSPEPTPELTPSPTPQPSPTEPPTAVELVYFKAKANVDGSVTLAWKTASEVDNAGFNIYRSKMSDGTYKKVNGKFIPAQGGGSLGASYSYEDTLGKGTFYYKLEDVDENGVSAMHGPVKVRVRSAEGEARRRR